MKLLSSLLLGTYYGLTTILAPVGLCYLKHKKRRDPPYGKRACELLGRYTSGFDSCIWFHTVSVGEAIAARPLIKAFIKRHPTMSVVVTTTTTTGAIEINKIEGITHVYAPLDSPCAVRSFIKNYNPTHLFIMETELWPSLLNVSKDMGVCVCVFNARMPEKTCVAYEKHKGLIKDIIASKLDLVIAQTNDDKERFERIGVNSKNILVSGSLKYDLSPNESLFREARLIKSGWKNIITIGAISTHEGEDEMIVETFYNLRTIFPRLRLVLVPRHQSNVAKAKQFLDEIQCNYDLRTETDRNLYGFDKDILIGNTMGEMEFYLGLCDLVFMGGSLVDIGGHNPLEPAYFSIPIITGPYYYNFAEQFENLIENRGAFVANDSQRLFSVCKMFLDDENLMLTTGMQAMDTQQQGRGSLTYTLDRLEDMLSCNP